MIYKRISTKLLLDQVLRSVTRSVSPCITQCCIIYCNFVIYSSKKKSVEYECPQTDLEEKVSVF